jgi:hypothetical protein
MRISGGIALLSWTKNRTLPNLHIKRFPLVNDVYESFVNIKIVRFMS